MTQPKLPGLYDDPDNYRKMSEPRPLAEVSSSAEAFFDDLRELRKKHHVKDLYTICVFAILTESGEEGETYLSSHFGDAHRAEALTAFALGQEQAARQERISAALGRGSAIKRPPKPKSST